MLKEETVKLFLGQYFKEQKTKLSPEALNLVTKLLELFVQEAADRATEQARKENVTAVDIEHLEKILPQLLLDFWLDDF